MGPNLQESDNHSQTLGWRGARAVAGRVSLHPSPGLSPGTARSLMAQLAFCCPAPPPCDVSEQEGVKGRTRQQPVGEDGEGDGQKIQPR